MPTLQHMNQPRGYPQKLSYALSRYREYLKSYYSNYSIARDDKLSIAPCSQFINLALIKKERSSCHDHFSQSTFYGGVDEIRRFKTPLEIDALVTPDSRFVLVEGPPGFGKSTFCWELCRQWDTLPSLQHYKIVLQLKLRDRRVQNATKLNEIFLHRDKRVCQSVVDEVLECEGEGVLLILDGFDEMPSSLVNDESSLIMELLSITCLPKAMRLVTSRPSALHHKTIFPEDHRHIEILGFTDECKVQFAEVAFKSEPDVFDHFKDFIFSNPIIKSLMYIPVNCAIIAQVYKDIRRSRKLMPKTMTQLYTTLILVLIRRHMIEKREWDKHSRIPNSLTDLPEKILSDLKRVSELACKGLIKEDAQLVFTDEDVGEGFQHLGLLSESKEMYVCEGATTSYSFLHLSIQEFLAAWHLACNFIPDTFFSILESKRLEIVKKFIAGLLGSGFPIEWMEKTEFMVHCLYEAQDSCKSLEGHVFSDRIGYYSTTPLDLYVFGYVLVHAPIQWYLTLDEYSDVSLLVNSCKDSNTILGSISWLYICDLISPCSLSKFEELPYLLEHVTKLYIGYNSEKNPPFPLPTRWMSSLHNLHTLELDQLCTLEDHSLVSWPNLRTLDVTFFGDELIGLLKVWSEIIASNHTLEYVIISHQNLPPVTYFIESRVLVEAAMSCSSLKTLSTDIPFLASSGTVSPNLKSIEFSCTDLAAETMFNCLCCIADMCKMPSMRSLKIDYNYVDYYPVHDKFLVILNHSLHCNSSFTCFKLIHFPLSLEYLSGPFLTALRTHPSLLSWNHSKSLSDLSTACEPRDVWSGPRDERVEWTRTRCQSCPDLLQMQPLHNIHPRLYKPLRINRLYYHESDYSESDYSESDYSESD